MHRRFGVIRDSDCGDCNRKGDSVTGRCSCSECNAEYRHYRLDWEESKAAADPRPNDSGSGPIENRPLNTAQVTKRWRFRAVPLAWAASLIVMCSGGYLAFRHYHSANAPAAQVASSQPVDAKVDLFNSGTLRGAGRRRYYPAARGVIASGNRPPVGGAASFQ